jgi:hypothetical protein
LAAILLSLEPVSTEFRILLFAVAILAFSLVVQPHLLGGLPGDAVDFWYYTLAIVGVVLFFFANDDQRRKLSLQDSYMAAAHKQAEQESLRDFLDAIPKERKRYYDETISHAQERAGSAETTAAISSFCAEIPVRLPGPFQPAFDDLLWLDPKNEYPRFDVKFDPAAMCRPDVQEDRQEVELRWRQIANAPDLSEAVKLIEEFNLGDKLIFKTDKAAWAFATAKSYLMLVPDSDEWKAEVKKIEEAIESAARTQTEANAAYGRLTGSISDSISFTRPAQVAHFIWPYVLTIALGMKLARRRDPH